MDSVESLEPVDPEGTWDHGDTEPTEEDVQRSEQMRQVIDPDDDDSGTDDE